MFMLKNVTKYLFGDTGKETLTQISQGQLYLVRPQSPKGYSELIFKDAAATIRRTGVEFQYQLVVQRAYEEGEEELDEEEEDENGLAQSLTQDKDEKTFLLDEALHFRSEVRANGDIVFAWKDLSGDSNDLYQFVCDPDTSEPDIATFGLVAVKCQYERKYRKHNDQASEEDLEEFDFQAPIPDASPIASKTIKHDPDSIKPQAPVAQMGSRANTGKKTSRDTLQVKDEAPTAAPLAIKAPTALDTFARAPGELHLYDFPSGEFIQQAPLVVAEVTEIGKWKYWLGIYEESGREWLGQEVLPEMNPVCNYEYLSLIFNYFSEDGAAYSWLLRFKEQKALEDFHEGLMRALWEKLNETKWGKIKDDERDYVLEAFQDITLKDVPEEEEEEYEEDEEEDDEVQRREHYDEDEDEDDFEGQPDDGNLNSQLAVGHRHDRSFVVRGSKIGVFKHNANNQLEFSTTISKVETPKGTLFSPKKVMLHQGDKDMILQKSDDPNSLYRMDLEYGKIVDEWKVHGDIPTINFAPEKKFAQLTDEATFLGIAKNALYRIDPRLAGNKLVDSQLKQYASKNEFSAAATTEQGYIAVASDKGDIRMFDRLGINAKTHIPALGEAIIGLDVSADGRWVLATCRTYLLLIDSLQKEGKYEGKLGFERSFGKDAKPQPRRLALSPAHVAQFQHETRVPIKFTPARFNTGEEEKETHIVSSTGPFVVDWSMKRALAGRKDCYTIKRYTDEVVADNFKFGSDKNVIVALPNEVNSIQRQALKKPTRESIMASPRKSNRMRLSRGDVVNEY